MTDHERNRDEWEEHDRRENHDERGKGGGTVTGRDMIEHRPNPARRRRWLAAIVGILGGWVVVQAVWFDLAQARLWNDVAVGAALLAAGAYNLFRRSNAEFGSAGVAALAALLGLWLVAAPFLFGLDSGADGIPAVTGVVVGLVVFVASSYSAYAIRARRREADPRPTAVYDRRGQ